MRPFVFSLAIALLGRPAFAATFCVDNFTDAASGSCANDCSGAHNANACTLRGAMALANATTGTDTIAFLASAAQTITLASVLPPLTDTVIVDGYSAAGASAASGSAQATIIVSLTGSGSGIGIELDANASTIRGLAIGGFDIGVFVGSGNTNNQISGNFIGLAADGSTANANTSDGIDVEGNDNLVGGTTAADGNVISGNTGSATTAGIVVAGTSNAVTGNVIGLDASGTTAVGNDVGVSLGGSLNLLGVGSTGAGNVIAANIKNDVALSGTSNQIAGNTIGFTAAGAVVAMTGGGYGIDAVSLVSATIGGTSAADGNRIGGRTGIAAAINIESGSITTQNNIIGLDKNGDAAGNTNGIWMIGGGPHVIANNVISGNVNGVNIQNGSNVTVTGNYIGTSTDGTHAAANTGDGIIMINTNGKGAAITIGGAAASDGNVISGNTDNGIELSSASATIDNNLIGVNLAGASLANGEDGIAAAYSSVLQIGDVGAGNIISCNGEAGIALRFGATAVIEGNFIGTDPTGAALGNLGDGISLQSGPDTVGGVVAEAGNTIAFNATGIEGGSQTVAILENAIYASTDFGIDMGAAGVTANDDSNESDSAFNFPVLTLATGNADSLSVSGNIVTSAHSATVRVEYFDAVTCDTSLHGEGRTYLGTKDVDTDASGNASFTTPLAVAVPDGHALSATATSLVSAVPTTTSEFSSCLTLTKFGTFGWSATAVNANAPSGAVTLTVARTDGSHGAVSVDVATASGSATSGTNFTALAETLAFADGEMSKDVTISLDNLTIASAETFTVTLSNVQGGGSLGAATVATVTIDESASGGSSSGSSAGGSAGPSSGSGSAGSSSGTTGSSTGKATFSGGAKKGCASSNGGASAAIMLAMLMLVRSRRR